MRESELKLLNKQIDKECFISDKRNVLVNVGALPNELLDLLSDLLVLPGIHTRVLINRAGVLDLSTLGRGRLLIFICSSGGCEVGLRLWVDVVEDLFD